MNQAREAARRIAARIAYMVALYWGEEMTYTHAGSSVAVQVIPACSAHASIRQWGNTISEELKNNFVIPTQDTFPPEDDGPIVLDTLTDDEGNVYTIRKWSVDSEKVCWTVDEAVLTKTRQVGATGV